MREDTAWGARLTYSMEAAVIERLLLICALILGPLLVSAPVAAQQTLAKPSIRGVAGSQVGWSYVTGATGYRLRWYKPNGARTFKIVDANTLIFTLTNLDAGANYTVQARALGDGVNYQKKSKWSAKHTFTAPSNPAQGPLELPAPPNFHLVSGTTLGWDAVTGVTSYRIRWKAPNGVTGFANLSKTTTQYTISPSQLQSGVTYDAQVRARGDGTNYEKKGPWSGVVQVQG